MALSSLNDTSLNWRGIHHIALATSDIEATIAFYKDILNMQVSDIFPSKDNRGRHCLVFVKPGDAETWGLHFFERLVKLPDTTSLEIAASQGHLLHIAFRVLDVSTAYVLRQNLERNNIPITDIEELGTFVFWDNNGIMLEITWH